MQAVALMLTTIVLGMVLGSWASGVCGWFFWSTRSYRRARNMLVIYIAQLVSLVSVVGSVVLLLTVLGRMGVDRTLQGDAALWAYAASVACGVFLVVLAEIRWRKSVGLDHKNLISSK